MKQPEEEERNVRGKPLGGATSFQVIAVVALCMNLVASAELARRLRQLERFTSWVAVPTAVMTGARTRSELALARSDSVEVYFDLFCDACVASIPQIDSLRRSFPDLEWVHVPLSAPPDVSKPSFEGGLASVCALESGGMWEDLGWLAREAEWDEDDLPRLIERLSMTRPHFDECVASRAAENRLWANRFRAASLGVVGTPTVRIDGQNYTGRLDLAALEAVLRNRRWR